MMTAIAEDWHEELSAYPSWAIQKAARWWMGSSNEKRRQKPLAGDISARAREEMGAVEVAKGALRRFESKTDWPPAKVKIEERQPLSADQRAEADRLVSQFSRNASAGGMGQ